jgi:N-carbamoylputrescine amidase
MQDIRIALAVCRSGVGKIRDNLDKVRFFAKAARNRGADLICFPEMNVTGYTNHPNIQAIAEPVPGPAADELSAIAAETRLLILAGMAEKGAEGTVYASHLAVYPDGRLETYRKIHIAPPEKSYYTPGNDAAIFKFHTLCFGIQLCYDAHFPELSGKMALSGAEILFIPHASPRGMAIEKHKSWMRHLTARAYDNSLFVVACNQSGSNGKGLSFPGNAVAIDPAGHVIAKSLSSRERICLTDLKTEVFDRVRQNPMHFFLPNRRPEIY